MFFAKQYALAVEYRQTSLQEKGLYSMCPRGVVNGRGLEKACKSVPPYPTGSLVLHKKETTAQRQSLPFLFGIHFLISAVSTMNFTLPVLPAGRPEKVW